MTNQTVRTATKQQLAQWMVDNNEDCGRDTYFSEDIRDAYTTEESFDKFMELPESELAGLVYDFSSEGQLFCEQNGL